MMCDSCGKPIIGGTGKKIGANNMHNWCVRKPARFEGITRGAFMLSVGALVTGVIGMRSCSSHSAKKHPTVAKVAVPMALNVQHDFQAGLDKRLVPSTEGPSGWHLSGLGVIPRELRLFKNKRPPQDYTLVFDCSVDDGALGWVCRAVDGQNHEGFVLSKSKGELEIVRYRTVAGIRTDLGHIPLDHYSHLSLLTISTKTDGDLFSLMVNGGDSDASTGQVVDSWRDRTFPRGTFGFFADKTDAPLLLGYQLLEKKLT